MLDVFLTLIASLILHWLHWHPSSSCNTSFTFALSWTFSHCSCSLVVYDLLSDDDHLWWKICHIQLTYLPPALKWRWSFNNISLWFPRKTLYDFGLLLNLLLLLKGSYRNPWINWLHKGSISLCHCGHLCFSFSLLLFPLFFSLGSFKDSIDSSIALLSLPTVNDINILTWKWAVHRLMYDSWEISHRKKERKLRQKQVSKWKTEICSATFLLSFASAC